MSKAIVVKFAPATTTKPKRCIAKMDSVVEEVEWNYDLTDSANYRLAANQALREHNQLNWNTPAIIITAEAMLPDPKMGYVFIAA